MRPLQLWVIPLALAASVSCREQDHVLVNRDGIALTLHNVGQASLDSVVVITTGRSYPLGFLAVGASRRVQIGADGESHVEIEHGTPARRRLVVGTYFESGYRGAIDVQLTADAIVAIVDSTT